MKISGTALITPLMSEMKVGQKGFLTTDSIVIVNGNTIFIGTGYSISDIKIDKYKLPIERTGPGEEDFAIDFYIPAQFFNTKLKDEDLQKLKENKNFIGPYQIETELYQAMNYQKQTYPRMDLLELLENFAEVNKLCMGNPDNEYCEEEKKLLRKLIKSKFREMPVNLVKDYSKYFAPLSKEESNDGELVNYSEDTYLHNFISQRISECEETELLRSMSLKELEVEKEKAIREEYYEKGRRIQNVIEEKMNAPKIK
jgi:hypothetical protein